METEAARLASSRLLERIGAIIKEPSDRNILAAFFCGLFPSGLFTANIHCACRPDNAKEKPQEVQAAGSILPLPILSGLHHHYVRIIFRHRHHSVRS
jgi:hypothetical protein